MYKQIDPGAFALGQRNAHKGTKMKKLLFILLACIMASAVYARDNTGGNDMDKSGPFGLGQPNTAYAKYFIGQSYLNPLVKEGVNMANVTFEPACRNNWHIHKATSGGGQILLCTSGRGWYQEWGKPARELKAGDVVEIPAGVKHWHGAAKDSWFAHIAVATPGENTSTEWLEPVDDAQYAKLP